MGESQNKLFFLNSLDIFWQFDLGDLNIEILTHFLPLTPPLTN
jgi:hypothetical protein